MRSMLTYLQEWLRDLWRAWDGFWFTPAAPHTLSLLRILAGAMLFYTHLVWSLDLMAFLGPQSWVAPNVIRAVHRSSFAWSYLEYISSPFALWIVHGIALAVFAALTVGFRTRITSVLAAIITLSYCHRLTGSLFGLDQVNAMFAIYLAVGPAGAAYSVDRWLSWRKRGPIAPPVATVGANVAVRLIQLHMCVIYLFGGIGKMRGEMWWDGSALWFAIANYEYQSLDLTWLVEYPFLIAFLTHATVFWETFYPVLVWPRLTRPAMLFMAVLVHGGIAIGLGMPTFGIAMIIGNMSFLSPEAVRTCLAAFKRRPTPAPQRTVRQMSAVAR